MPSRGMLRHCWWCGDAVPWPPVAVDDIGIAAVPAAPGQAGGAMPAAADRPNHAHPVEPSISDLRAA